MVPSLKHRIIVQSYGVPSTTIPLPATTELPPRPCVVGSTVKPVPKCGSSVTHNSPHFSTSTLVRPQSSPELILRQSVARHEADSILPAAARFPLDLAAVRHHLQTDPGRSKALLLQALRRVSSHTLSVVCTVSLRSIANTC